MRRFLTPLLIALAFAAAPVVHAETVSIVVPSNAAPRVVFGAEKIAEALKAVQSDPVIVQSDPKSGLRIIISRPSPIGPGSHLIWGNKQELPKGNAPEVFWLAHSKQKDGFPIVMGGDDSGTLYGCLELAKRIRAEGKVPIKIAVEEKPGMTLRGTCVAMQKTYILPGRKVYEYPYTPDTFPWFYDKKLWTEYLDFLVENRMNTLYLWNGHPFASLVRLKDYPYAVEVPDDVFAKNQEQFRWLAQECDKRGIWLVQMFYNIFVSKPFAETNGIPTQLSAPTPLVSDYTRKSIAEFVKEYPNVGLMVCLGEALQGTANQLEWSTNVILPGMLDGMRAAHLKEEPPIIVRTHAMDANAIIPPSVAIYSNLFTETKFNGESLTTYEPRGKGQATHQAMSKLSPHLANIHILSNLEPFRYGDTEFIRKSVLAARDRLGASGIHLYPLSYWNWPYAPDIAEPQLLQWDRDWIWFESWARYSWNPDLPAASERLYWVGRLAEMYGNTNAGEKILDAYNNSGEVAPMLIRRFGITEGNRQTLSLGMTLDQLVNPKRYNVLPDLWESQSPPGERLPEFVEREWKKQPHEGETPESIIHDVLLFSSNAVAAADAAESQVTKNHAEFERVRNDVHCIQAMAQFYSAKVRAAECVLRFDYSKDIADMRTAEQHLAESYTNFLKLVALTEKTYQYANSMQTSQRKIPVPGGSGGKPANYLWSQLAPVYEKELKDFRAQVAQLKPGAKAEVVDDSKIQAWPTAKFSLISTNAETYTVERGAKAYTDRYFTIEKVAPELKGLTGIRFSHTAAKDGLPPIEFEVSEPVYVLVGYFENPGTAWLQVPNLEFAAQADDRGGIETVLEHAAAISGCPDVNIHAFRFDAGKQKLELIGKGSFVVLGVVPQSVKLQKRDANIISK